MRAHSTLLSEPLRSADELPWYLRHPGALSKPRAPWCYERRKPEDTVLHDVVSRNLGACLSAAQERGEHGFGYPAFVGREFEKYLDCGQLRRGFVRVKCAECPNEKLVAFSCKGRGFCPSCTARRMSNTAAHIVDNVLPALPYRQWVLSVPRRVRFLLATDHDLLSRVLDMALRKVFAWQKRAARRRGITAPMCGAIGFVQRFGSLLNLNCHFHNILPDGVFAEDINGDVVFRPVPPPSKADVQTLAKQIARGTEKLIAKREQREFDDERPALLAQEQAKSLNESSFRGGGKFKTIEHPSRRHAFFFGYSLHAERIAPSGRIVGAPRDSIFHLGGEQENEIWRIQKSSKRTS
ncbi:MAG: transposase [Myxococcales bacterium]|nr:transposase [Myxococcales bacterium]